VLDSNYLLEQQLEEYKQSATQANETRLKSEQAKKTALEQLHILRQEAEIQREDLRSAEAETKKAWKIVENANSKASAQAKYLQEAQDAKFELTAKSAALQRSMDELSNSTKLGGVEKSRLETEISTLQRRLKTEQEARQRAEADVSMKNRELAAVKLQDSQASRLKVAAITDQKEKLEVALKDWQTRHADLAARLDASETQKSRSVLEIEDLVFRY
jgi:chromosome segregation ATPase